MRSLPIRRTIRRLMASPSPAPPWRRFGPASACSNSLNSRSASSGAIPGPVSATVKTTTALSPTGRLDPGRQQDAAMVGEFHPVADEIDQHLAKPGRVDRNQRRHRRIDVGDDIDAAGMGARRQQFDDLLQQRREVGRLRPQVETLGLDPREIEHVVDQAEQRVAG